MKTQNKTNTNGNYKTIEQQFKEVALNISCVSDENIHKTAQDILNEIEREQKTEQEQNERGKQRANEFKQMFYKNVWLQEQTDLNLSKVVGK